MNSVASSTRSVAASTALAAVALLALIGCAWLFTATRDPHDAVWAELTVAVTFAGLVALGWLRSARVVLTAPQVMLLLGAAGMVGGLAIDARAGGFATLATLCLANSGDFMATMRLHWQQLPVMHLGMIIGGLATVPLLRSVRPTCRRQFCARLVQNLACSAWMVAGMTAGTIVFVNLAAYAGGRSPAAMLGGMFSGMVWGMVVSVSVYRLWFWAIGRTR
jgi:ABC-type glycerol-3-phosphate transport system permease component